MRPGAVAGDFVAKAKFVFLGVSSVDFYCRRCRWGSGGV